MALTNLVNENLLSKESKIQREIKYASGIAVYLVVHKIDICRNSNIGVYESRTLSASIIVIDSDEKVYLFQIPRHLFYDIYYVFNHIERVTCDDEKAEIIINRGSYADGNLLFNQSNKLFKLAFGNLDSNDETGHIICERR